MTDRVSRRAVLGLSGAALASLAGCTDVLGSGSSNDGGDGDGGGGGTQGDPAARLGSDDAPATVETYEDFSCPHCATFSIQVLDGLLDDYVESEQAQFVHHDFPLPVDDWSWPAANAGRAVAERADARTFYDYAHALFENQQGYSNDLFGSLAAEVGVEAAAVRQAASDQSYRDAIETDRQSGRDRGVNSTPTVFVNGEQVAGNTWNAFEQNVRDAIEAAGE